MKNFIKSNISQDSLSLLFVQAPVALSMLMGDEFVIQVANPQMLEILGKNIEIIGKKLIAALPELEGQPFIEILTNVKKTGETYKGYHQLTKLIRNGKEEECFFDSTFAPIYNEDETEIIGVSIVAIESTKQVLTKQRIKENEQRYKNLADSLPIIIWTADKNGNIDYYNQKWYDYTGFEGIDSRESATHKILHPDDVKRAMHIWKTSQQNKSAYEIEYQFKDNKTEDSYKWFLGRAVPIKDPNDNIIQWIGTCTDIDEFKQFQQQKDNFLGIASHELKTPLTSLKLYSQFLEKNLRKQDDNKNADVAMKMDEQVNKLTSLVNDLLDVTKIQNGKILLNRNEFDFDELVNEVIAEQQMSTSHRIYLENERIGNIYGDKNRISQVMTNLISNAIKYSPDSDNIQITTKLTEEDCVHFSVRDFGIGIPEDKQDRVFEQYYRVSGSKEHTFPGLGLGLYISSEIIKRSGGRIFVNSVEGKGSDFCFEIPKNYNH